MRRRHLLFGLVGVELCFVRSRQLLRLRRLSLLELQCGFVYFGFRFDELFVFMRDRDVFKCDWRNELRGMCRMSGGNLFVARRLVVFKLSQRHVPTLCCLQQL